jgi:hypothetical protein|tara:strand:- start:3950 stop:4249 length:300 start_codon:yes stop_codon:yes gene_type:complete
MSKKWIEEEIELMLNCASLGFTPKETSDYLDKNGFSRTATAIPLKFAHVTGKAWGEDIVTQVVKQEKEMIVLGTKPELDWVIITVVTIGIVIFGYWWSQ